MWINRKLQMRLRKEESGFTLIELLIVLVIIGVLLAIAVPSYLGFKKRAEKSAAQSNVRAAIPAMEAYYSDNGTYAGATAAALSSIDTGLASGLVTSGLPPERLHDLVHAGPVLCEHDRPRRLDHARTASRPIDSRYTRARATGPSSCLVCKGRDPLAQIPTRRLAARHKLKASASRPQSTRCRRSVRPDRSPVQSVGIR